MHQYHHSITLNNVTRQTNIDVTNGNVNTTTQQSDDEFILSCIPIYYIIIKYHSVITCSVKLKKFN